MAPPWPLVALNAQGEDVKASNFFSTGMTNI